MGTIGHPLCLCYYDVSWAAGGVFSIYCTHGRFSCSYWIWPIHLRMYVCMYDEHVYQRAHIRAYIRTYIPGHSYSDYLRTYLPTVCIDVYMYVCSTHLHLHMYLLHCFSAILLVHVETWQTNPKVARSLRTPSQHTRSSYWCQRPTWWAHNG